MKALRFLLFAGGLAVLSLTVSIGRMVRRIPDPDGTFVIVAVFAPLLVVFLAIAAFIYSRRLGRSPFLWAMAVLLFPMFAPIVLTFMRPVLLVAAGGTEERVAFSPSEEVRRTRPERKERAARPRTTRTSGVSAAGSSCMNCGRSILTKRRFVEVLAENGIEVDPANVDSIRVSGVAGSYDAYLRGADSIRAQYDEIQKGRAFRCVNCGRTYCMDCLLHEAPPHPNGGKACLSCGGAFAEV